MSQRDRATVDIHSIAVQFARSLAGKILPGKSLIDFNEVQIGKLQTRFIQRHLDCGNGTNAHDFRRNTRYSPTDDATEQLPLRMIRRGYNHSRGAIDDTAGIAGSNESVF